MKFLLKEKEGRATIQIYLAYSHGGKRTLFFTGETIGSRKEWNIKTNAVKEDNPLYGGKETNTRLIHFRSKLDQLITQIRTEGNEPSIEEIKRRFNFKKETSKKEAEQSEFNLLTAYIEFLQYNKEVANRSADTITSYTNTYNHLYFFQKHRKQVIQFNSINEDFINRFSNYLQTVYVKYTKVKDGKIVLPSIERIGVNDNMLNKTLRVLKTFLIWSNKQGYYKGRDFIKEIKIKETGGDNIALTDEQLTHLAQIELPDRLEDVRAVYVVGSLTGLRLSDLQTLKKGHIHINKAEIERSYIERTTTKGNKKVRLPLLPAVTEILLRYDCSLPSVARTTFNRYIKEIGQLAGFTEPTQVTELKRKKQVHITKPAFSFMSSHQMRRNFITLLIRRGVKAEMIMLLTGHTTYSSFKRYFKNTDEDGYNTMKVLEGII